MSLQRLAHARSLCWHSVFALLKTVSVHTVSAQYVQAPPCSGKGQCPDSCCPFPSEVYKVSSAAQ